MLLWMLVITFAAALKGSHSPIKMVASGPKEGKVSGSLPLTCTVTGTPLDSPRYDWNSVRQAPGGELQFLGWIYPFGNNTGYAPPFQGRVTISADKDKNKISLQLHDLTALDTATYFCARQNTVMPVEGEAAQKGRILLCVATDKLVFGTGITFSVEPSNQEEASPEVIVLKSKEPKQYDNKLNMACLARTFYPKSISLDVPESDISYDLKAPVVTSEGLYSTMKVTRVEPDAKVTCKAIHKGNKTTASIILPDEKTEEFETANACNVTDASTKDVKMEKVNMLFISVLFLRVLLAKSIAFNTIMSVKLFLF
ncbi:immunoglobulin delta heavy chain-like [Athene noctua]|uniref:immunoglobulin delta heavy chain-like n=1 Tax=Athene noctua TaxID=126797 RepID=UPI003EC0A7C7